MTIRGDSEPSIKSFLQAVSVARARLGVATRVELAPPDSKLHHGLKAERFIGIVRDLGNTLLETRKEHLGFTVRSGHPVFQWAFRHSAFLYTRFHVQESGQTAFELVHGRSYTGKICPYGGAVFAQLLPVTPAKGNGWTKEIFLGKSTLGNLNIIGTNTGVHYARTMRRGPLSFETELIASTRGVPGNATLDVIPVKRKKPQNSEPQFLSNLRNQRKTRWRRRALVQMRLGATHRVQCPCLESLWQGTVPLQCQELVQQKWFQMQRWCSHRVSIS